MRAGLATAALLLASLLAACSGSGADEPEVFDDFTMITDCGELERLASTEVDRINSTTDPDIVNAATARFQRIVEHRDSVCS